MGLQREPSPKLFGEAVAPVIRMPAVVLESQNTNVVGKNAIENRKRKTWHEITPHFIFHDTPSIRSIKNNRNRAICRVEELRAKTGNFLLVKLRSLDQFGVSIGMVNYLHPIARRAACITCSCVRPTTAPEDNASSRQMASRTAVRSSASTNPASMLSQSDWASNTRSKRGRFIASSFICCVDMAKSYSVKIRSSTCSAVEKSGFIRR